MRNLPYVLLPLFLFACAQDPLPGNDLSPPDVPLSEPDDLRSRCNSSGWCWERGGPISQVRETQGTVVATGSQGLFLVWNGEQWVPDPVPTNEAIISGWVSDSQTWAIDASGNVWRRNARCWDMQPGEGLDVPAHDIFVREDGSVFAYTAGGGAVHGTASGVQIMAWTGMRWMQHVEPIEHCIGGALLIDDEATYSAGLSCDAEGTVDSAEVYRHDGTQWNLMGSPIPDQGWYPSLHQIDGTLEIRASSYFRWDGSGWVDFVRPQYPQDLLIGGTASWNGTSWSRFDGRLGCQDAFRATDGTTFCYGSGQIFLEQGSEWTPTLADPFSETSEPELWGQIPPNLWAGSDSRIAWGTSASNVYRARGSNRNYLEHYDGTAWTVVIEEQVIDIIGAGPNEIWVTTASGLRFNGGAGFQPVVVPAETLGRLHIDEGATLYVVADRDRLLQRTDDGWEEIYRVTDYNGFEIRELWSHEGVLRLQRHGTVQRIGTVITEEQEGDSWRMLSSDEESQTGLSTGASGFFSRQGARVIGPDFASEPITEWEGGWGARLWVGPDAVWILDHRQAVRHRVP